MEKIEDLLEDFKLWLSVLGYSSKSIVSYSLHIKELLEYLEKESLGLNEEGIKSYLNYTQNRPKQKLSGGLSGSTIKSKFGIVKLFMKYLVLMKHKNIEVKIPELKVNYTHRLAISKLEIEALYKVINEGEEVYRNRVIMCLYYGCGLRRSEGLEVRLKDVLIGQKLLYVWKGKGGKPRYVPLSKEQVKDLKNYLHYERSSTTNIYLLLHKNGKKMSASSICRRLKKWKEKAEIKSPLSLHVLRHSIATHLLENGMKLVKVSQFLGHSSLLATQRYTHIQTLKK